MLDRYGQDPEAAVERTRKLKRWSTTALSTLVFPGLGQLVQQRWVAGAVFGLLSVAFVVWFFVAALAVIVPFYQLAADGDAVMPTQAETMRRIMQILIPLVLGGITHVWNIVDVVRANHRLGGREDGAK